MAGPNLQRGEVWLVDFNPPRGAEINKIRPAVIISSDAVGILPLKIVAPITEWKNAFAVNIWHIRVDPSYANGLNKTGAIDTFQIRSVSVQRFNRKLGVLEAEILEEVTAAIAAIIEHQ